jgi:hypothetical protein
LECFYNKRVAIELKGDLGGDIMCV